MLGCASVPSILIQHPKSSQNSDWIHGMLSTPKVLFSCKIQNLSHQMGILHAWSIKSRRNKQLIA